MISLNKLGKLPRGQRLRKIALMYAAAEKTLCSHGHACAGEKPAAEISAAELRYFSDAAELLARDKDFSAEAGKVFSAAAEVFGLAAVSGLSAENTSAVKRALNGARHLLLAEAGRSQSDWDFIGSDGQLDPARRLVIPGMQVYLEDIRSPFNVGAMFRSAESFGAEKIFVSRFCADPNHARARRTAMGCVDVLPWERRDLFSVGAPEPELRCPVFAMETGGIPLAEFPFPRQGLLIAGSEELGVSPTALAAADASLGRVSIPCYGAKGSLNVSVAFGIVMQAWAQAVM